MTPNSWREMPFSEALQINPSIRLDRGSIYPYVDMASVSADSRNAGSMEEREFKGGGSKFRCGDTLMARITPCLENGKIARYQTTGDQQVAHGSTEFIVIRGRENVTDSDFAYYLTRWNEVRDYAISQMTGTSGRQRVPVDSLDHLTVGIPTFDEQHTIASILGTLDDKIELNRRMNETQVAIARALFRSWFVDFEPVRAKMEGHWRLGESLPGLPADLYDLFPDRLVDSELGEIPEGWEVKALGEVASVSSGKRPGRRQSVADEEVHTPLWGGNGPMGFVDFPLINSPILLTGRVGTLGSVFRITFPCWPSDNTLVVIPISSELFESLFFQMERFDFDSLNRGSTQPLLTQADLKAQLVISPANELIGRFHTFTKRLFQGVDARNHESLALAAQRDVVLPRLVSGQMKLESV